MRNCTKNAPGVRFCTVEFQTPDTASGVDIVPQASQMYASITPES